jgi:HD-GYP domain-containing protein (c-di-GMP phosphodiesterase class II)
MADALSPLLREQEEVGVTLNHRADPANGRARPAAKGATADLVKAAIQHSIDRIVISGDLTARQVIALVQLLGKRRDEVEAKGGLPSVLAQQGLTCIVCEIAAPPAEVSVEQAPPGVDASLVSTYGTALGVIQESTQQARLGRVLNAAAAQTLASQLADNMIEDQAKLLGLLSIRKHDEYTFQHSLNVCVLALALGMAMGLDRPRLHALGLAAILHDVGKAWVPLEVLRKPGRLTEDELALIQQHPVRGAIYLSQQPEVPPPAALVAFQHHLGYDQRGYPKLRWPHSLNAYSLIAGIADAYEALTSDRPYRPTLGPDEALGVMLETPPGQFEPRMLDVFAEMLSKSHLLAESPDPSAEREPSSTERQLTAAETGPRVS